MRKLILNFFFFLLSLMLQGSFLDAQEYPTDRLFMKHFKKSQCLHDVEKKVKKLKKRREMTLEHEILLNNNIWNKIRAKIPLSHGEMKRLLNIKEKGHTIKKLTSKKLWAIREKEFKELRSNCK